MSSIIDENSGLDPTNWLQEKSLMALEHSFRLVDLANAPTTPPELANSLRRETHGIVNCTVKLVAFHFGEEDACLPKEWEAIQTGGSTAFKSWRLRWGINPNQATLQAAQIEAKMGKAKN